MLKKLYLVNEGAVSLAKSSDITDCDWLTSCLVFAESAEKALALATVYDLNQTQPDNVTLSGIVVAALC